MVFGGTTTSRYEGPAGDGNGAVELNRGLDHRHSRSPTGSRPSAGAAFTGTPAPSRAAASRDRGRSRSRCRRSASRIAPGSGARLDVQADEPGQPAPAALKLDVLQAPPGVEVRRRVDGAVVAEASSATGWISKCRWYGVPSASPVLPTKPSTVPARTCALLSAYGEYAERCA